VMHSLKWLVVLATVMVAAGSMFVGSALADNIPHGDGVVQHAPTFYAVYWLPSGDLFEPGVVGGNQQYEDRINQFLTDVSKTNLANVVSQYYDASGSVDMTHSTFGGSWVDTNDYPVDGSKDHPLQDSDIRGEVESAFDAPANESWQSGTNTTVFVFTAKDINMCAVDRSTNGCTPEVNDSVAMCGYHWFDSPFITAYAGLPEDATLGVNSKLAGCAGTAALPQGDVYADTEITDLSHELFEAATDPSGGGWTDPNGGVTGAEIGDKCASDFGWEPWFGPSGYNVDGRLYYMQQEWSNITGQCEGSNLHPGFFQGYGPFAATAEDPTGSLLLAKTNDRPDLVAAPSPTIDWGDGSSTDTVSIGSCMSTVCDLNTDGHTYAVPGTYTMTLTYHVGCCIPDTMHISIEVLGNKLTITPHDQSIHYGDPAPDFAAPGNVDYVGLKPGDTVTGLTCAAYDHSGNQIDPSTAAPTGVGDAYNIICSNAAAPPAYNIAYKSGKLTIIPAGLTIAAKDQTTTYGAADKFDRSTNSMSVTGLKNAESPSVLGSGLTITSDATATSPVGTYTLTPSGATDSNYAITYKPGTLHVVPAALTVTADGVSRPFGTANPPLTATLSGFVNGEALATSGVTGTAACSTTATPWSAVGSYPIDCTLGTLTAKNYIFPTFISGTLKATSTAPCQTGTVNGSLNVAAGQVVCLAPGAKRNGSVNVAAGGTLDLEGATIDGSIKASGAGVVRLCGATVKGSLTISDSTGLVLVGGDAATGACAPSTISGSVTLTNNKGGVELNGNTIGGSLTISGTTGSLPPPDTGSVHAVGNSSAGR
jgi:MBG domain (YGX type)